MKTKITETETEYIVNGDLILTEDFKISKHLIVHGDVEGKDGERFNINARNIDAGNINAWNIDARNINALDINAWNIDAWNIDARNIICETRVKKDKKCKTIARIYIKNRSKIKRKEHDD